MVEIFVYEEYHTKIITYPCTIISIIMFYVTMLSCTNIKTTMGSSSEILHQRITRYTVFSIKEASIGLSLVAVARELYRVSI